MCPTSFSFTVGGLLVIVISRDPDSGVHHIVMLDLKEGTKHEDILKLQTSMLLGGMREKGEFVTYIPEKASTPKPSYQGYFP